MQNTSSVNMLNSDKLNYNKFEYKTKKNKKIGELYSAISHGTGALLSIAGIVLMLIKVKASPIPVIIYGVGIIFLYTFSSLYHFFPKGKVKTLFRKFDHIGIYIFIAATYTPLCIFSLPKNIGILILSVIWGCALIGVLSNTVFKYKNIYLRLILYILMGWIIVFAFKPLLNSFYILHLNWLILGGVFYTVGAFLYAFGKKFNDKAKQFTHDIFHIFVLAGSFAHYWFLYSYVI
ncbi:hemolysin III family protein [uncultured Brachyspira sp.]|uniref:PAQR family membrane homeostasis protein TrhA n=1 Tax=uncultured Brachyspira sp. TaxID=221953 RepID=UPI002631354A|nr:hemolysin III family protein [uncultured Brachyspira sp.]